MCSQGLAFYLFVFFFLFFFPLLKQRRPRCNFLLARFSSDEFIIRKSIQSRKFILTKFFQILFHSLGNLNPESNPSTDFFAFFFFYYSEIIKKKERSKWYTWICFAWCHEFCFPAYKLANSVARTYNICFWRHRPVVRMESSRRVCPIRPFCTVSIPAFKEELKIDAASFPTFRRFTGGCSNQSRLRVRSSHFALSAGSSASALKQIHTLTQSVSSCGFKHSNGHGPRFSLTAVWSLFHSNYAPFGPRRKTVKCLIKKKKKHAKIIRELQGGSE